MQLADQFRALGSGMSLTVRAPPPRSTLPTRSTLLRMYHHLEEPCLHWNTVLHYFGAEASRRIFPGRLQGLIMN